MDDTFVMKNTINASIIDPSHLMSRKNQTNLNSKMTSIKMNTTLRSRKHLLWRLFLRFYQDNIETGERYRRQYMIANHTRAQGISYPTGS